MLENKQIQNLLLKIIEIKNKGILQDYENYTNYYQKESNSIRNYYNNIRNKNLTLDYSKLTKEEKDFLVSLDIYHLFGNLGNNELSLILTNNILSPTSIINKVTVLAANVEFAFEKIKTLNSAFKFLPENVMKVNSLQLEEGKGKLNIHFQKNCNITGLTELKKQADTWTKILGTFYELDGETPPENIEFDSIEMGSLNINFSSTTTFLIKLGAFITFVLNSYSTYLDIQIKHKELAKFAKGYKDEEGFKQHLEEALEDKKKEITEEVITKMEEEIKQQIGAEIKNKLRNIVIPEVISFIEKGGEINVTLPTTEEENSEVKTITYDVKAIEKDTQELLPYIEKVEGSEDKEIEE